MNDQPIPLSELERDLDAPGGGWPAYLAGRGVRILEDDIGRPAISRSDARQLFVERRESEARARELRERQEAEAEARRVASIPAGIPRWKIPEGVSPAQAMGAADPMTGPRRRTPLEDALAGDGMTFHPIRSEPDGGE